MRSNNILTLILNLISKYSIFTNFFLIKFPKLAVIYDCLTCDPPKPYVLCDKPSQSNIDILNILNELNSLLPQFSNFIIQFNNVINQTGVNVITDTVGNMSIDVPVDMPDSESHNISTRINIIDRLINTRKEEINELLKKGFELEKNLKSNNSNYISELVEKMKEFERLKNSYKY